MNDTSMPADFVSIDNPHGNIILDIRYFGSNNFVGKPIIGYEAGKCILHEAAAKALNNVSLSAKKMGLGLRIFDGYRPVRAVKQFVEWIHNTEDQSSKAEYYPHINKEEILGDYLIENSSHSRGSTVDLTLFDLQSSEDLDMGSPFDLFDPLSHTDNPGISDFQLTNRHLLRDMMRDAGFADYAYEWWHFTLRDEAYPDTYFDFVIR